MPPADFAVYALTGEGARLAARICGLPGWGGGKIFLAAGLKQAVTPSGAASAASSGEANAYFNHLAEILAANFSKFACHVLICAGGIAVRALAPLVRDKTTDPAVLLLDQQGKFVISLLAGHLGGANRSAGELALALTNAPGAPYTSQAVITTATDLQNVPAIDLLAQESNLHIVNPGAIRHINSALLKFQEQNAEAPLLCDSDRLLDLPATAEDFFCRISTVQELLEAKLSGRNTVLVNPARFADLSGGPQELYESCKILVLQSKRLWLGLGCKKKTSVRELREFIHEELLKYRWSFSNLSGLASIDLKKSEAGLMDFAASLKLPLFFFSAAELDAVKVENPSSRIKTLTGTASVCEAAALLAASRLGGGHESKKAVQPVLVLSKRKGPGMTLALASARLLISAEISN